MSAGWSNRGGTGSEISAYRNERSRESAAKRPCRWLVPDRPGPTMMIGSLTCS